MQYCTAETRSVQAEFSPSWFTEKTTKGWVYPGKQFCLAHIVQFCTTLYLTAHIV